MGADALEPGEGPLAELVAAGHGGRGERWDGEARRLEQRLGRGELTACAVFLGYTPL